MEQPDCQHPLGREKGHAFTHPKIWPSILIVYFQAQHCDVGHLHHYHTPLSKWDHDAFVHHELVRDQDHEFPNHLNTG